MRLLNAKTLTLEYFTAGRTIPHYAILSHTWNDNELTFKDLDQSSRQEIISKRGYEKVEKCCDMALKWELEWVWMDTCCIDQASSAELSEAINSMYEWYRQSSVCYAYLEDVHSIEEDFLSDRANNQTHFQRQSSFQKARWFTRGWCLQELLAPRNMHFYNAHWEYIGSKHSLKSHISMITGIDEYGMFISDLSVLSVAHRMSWAALRKTTREEDIAYCLLGIFNINMPLLYGEGGVRAFARLQEEIMRRTEDHSIFAWSGKGTDFGNDMVGFLAPHPSAFSYGKVVSRDLPRRMEPLSITGRGIQIQVPLIRQGTNGDNTVAVIGCHLSGSSNCFYAIPIIPVKESLYRRRSPDLQIVSSTEVEQAMLETIFLLRHSKPTHLEDNNTRQVWFSLLEMRDCIYQIKGAVPATVWNSGRNCFAYQPSDWGGYPKMAVAFTNAKGKGFILRIDLDLLNCISTLDLVELEEPDIKEKDFNMEKLLSSMLLPNKRLLNSQSQLDLGRHLVKAIVQRSVVFDQELYEVKVTVGCHLR